MIRFCLDSTVFINSWTKHYPHDLFPSVWNCLDGLLSDKTAVVPRMIYSEIEAKDDELFAWLKMRKTAIVEPDEEVVRAVKKIMASHGRLVKAKKNRSGGDPWVIAHAQICQATVVTDENSGGKDPKIPDVCEHLGVPYMRTLEMLRIVNFRAE